MTRFSEGEARWSGIVGYNMGTVENIIYRIGNYSEGDANFVDRSDGNPNQWTGSVGGIAANNYGTIRNCWNQVNIETPYLRLGGIAGWNYGTIENCINTGNLRGYNSAANNPRAGGIAGATELKYESRIKNCVNYGTVGLKPGYSRVSVGPVVGGICGDLYYPDDGVYRSTEIYNCFFGENCFFIDGSFESARILAEANGPNLNSEHCLVLSSGTINGSYGIAAGTVAACGSDQTLNHGNSLLSALNGYVGAVSDPALKKWKTEAGGRVCLDF